MTFKINKLLKVIFLIVAIILSSISVVSNYIDYKKSLDITGSISEAPTEVVKLRAYVDNASPSIHSTTDLIVYGPVGGKVTAICHLKEHDEPYIFQIGREGMEIKNIRVNTEARGYTVVIDVILNYNGKTYRTNAFFTPI